MEQSVHDPIFAPPCLLAALAAAGMLGASAGAGLSDCASLINDFNGALERATGEIRQGSLEPARGSIGAMKALEKQIGLDAACGNRLVDVQRRRTAAQLLLAQQLIAGGGKITDPDYEGQVVLDADEPDVSWRAAYALGEIRFAQRRYAEAAGAYDRAIENIKNRAKLRQARAKRRSRQLVDRCGASAHARSQRGEQDAAGGLRACGQGSSRWNDRRRALRQASAAFRLP